MSPARWLATAESVMTGVRVALPVRATLVPRRVSRHAPSIAWFALCAAALTMAAVPGSPVQPIAMATSLEAALEVDSIPSGSRLNGLEVRPGSLIVVTPAQIQTEPAAADRQVLANAASGYLYEVRPPRDMAPWFVAALLVVVGLTVRLVTPAGPRVGAYLATCVLAVAYTAWADDSFAVGLVMFPPVMTALAAWRNSLSRRGQRLAILTLVGAAFVVGLGYAAIVPWDVARGTVAALVVVMAAALIAAWVARTRSELWKLHGDDVTRWPRALLLRQLIAEGLGGSAPGSAAADRERRRLAAMLHADVLPPLERVRNALTHDPRAQAELMAIEGRLRAGLGARHPVSLDAFGLIVGLESLAEQVENVDDVRVELDIDEGRRRPPRPIERAAFHVAWLAVDNAVRRGRAKNVAIAGTVAERRVELVITDDGEGSTPLEAERATRAGRMGLVQMMESAYAVGGTATWGFGEQQGFTVRFEWSA